MNQSFVQFKQFKITNEIEMMNDELIDSLECFFIEFLYSKMILFLSKFLNFLLN